MGYAPKTVQPDAFFDFYNKLCRLCNTAKITPETESRLLLMIKEVIDYARNHDKTVDKKYLDDDLYKALRYVGNDAKTDKRMYASGIYCSSNAGQRL